MLNKLLFGAKSQTQDVIVNAAAYTAVDKAESEPDIAARINAEAPGEMALAAARGELQAFANTIGGPSGARRPWVETGQMRVLFNFEPEAVRGLGVPTVFEHVKTKEQREVLTFFAGNVLLGRPMLAPPGVPADRVNALRRALAACLTDPILLKEAAAAKFEIAYQSGEKLARLVAEIAATPPEVVKKAERASQAQ